MSSALAIAAVTAVLKDLLNDGLLNHDWAAHVGPVTVSALPPDRIDLAAAQPQNQLNLFFYQATPNQAWRNEWLPSRNSDGDRTTSPPLALDLHYLLTAYGVQDFHAEILLGYAMQLLHEVPVLTRAAIRRSLDPAVAVEGDNLPAGPRFLAASNLADQVEQVKITPEHMTTEELAKLWTGFQTHYRPTAAYQASVVLIQSERPARPALPVRERALFVQPFRHPELTAVDPPLLPFRAGALVTLRGSALLAPNTSVFLGDLETAPQAVGSTAEALLVPVPANARAGVLPVRVSQRLAMGAPPLKPGFESNVAAFVLAPQIRRGNPPPNPAPYLIDPQRDGGDNAADTWTGTIQVTLDPPVGRSQRVALLLNGPPPADPPQSYRFEGPSRAQAANPTTNVLTFPVARVVQGDYLVRVEVDGAVSPLDRPADVFAGPRITLPLP